MNTPEMTEDLRPAVPVERGDNGHDLHAPLHAPRRAGHDGQPHPSSHPESRAHDSPHPHPDPAEHAEAIPADLPRIGTLQVLALTVAFLALLAGLFLLGYFPHTGRVAQTNADAVAARDAVPVVNVAQPVRPTDGLELLLPADVQAYQTTSIYGRANGYLSNLLVDIGDSVAAGQLLAQIATPEIDAQLNQARANAALARVNLVKARADLALAQRTLERYDNVGDQRAVSQQDIDQHRTQVEESQAAVDVSSAAIDAADAEVHRLEALQNFEQITAPFPGIITARNYDLGALLSPSTTGAGKELFQLARTDVLRVFVNVPQSYATAVQLGQSAELLVRNYPGRPFTGEVARSAGALNPATRTVRIEVDVPNPDKSLFAGMYGQVRFHIADAAPLMRVPTSALVYNADGLHVAVVDDNKVHFQKVSVVRDFGNELEIANGLSGNEYIVTNPGENLTEGTVVHAKGTGGAAPGIGATAAR